jgi:serine/threonine protein kinase
MAEPMPPDSTRSDSPVSQLGKAAPVPEPTDTVNPPTPSEATPTPTTRPGGEIGAPPGGSDNVGLGQLGQYVLLQEIGQGGMGKVFKARNVNVDRIVAVKLLLSGPWASVAEVRRFLQEARALANLDHPNIIPVYDRGEHDGRHWFSMKYVEGGSLSQRAMEFQVDPRRATRLVATVARAVSHAHARGILHRDIKPGNILLDSRGEPLVTDFGLAKWSQDGDSLTSTGATLGTPGYMAPEQIGGGKTVTAAADVYGLGAVLYHLLTGCPPFTGDTPFETMKQVQERVPVRPALLNPLVPLALERICLRCLAKDPIERYSSADTLADELEECLAGAEVGADRVKVEFGQALLTERSKATTHARRVRKTRSKMRKLVVAPTGGRLNLWTTLLLAAAFVAFGAILAFGAKMLWGSGQ